MATWHYYNEKGEKITVTGGQIKGLAKAGLITPDTIVETEEGKSAPARKVQGLTFAGPGQSKSTILTPNYYYTDANGQRQGAFTPQQLKALVEKGVITPDTPLETDTGHKGLAGQVKGLFDAPPAPNPFTAPITSQAMPQSVPVPLPVQQYDYRQIAALHRLSAWSILLFILGKFTAVALMTTDIIDIGDWLGFGIMLGIVSWSIVCMVRLAKSLQYWVIAIIPLAICLPIGVLGLIPLCGVYLYAGSVLKKAGYKFGFIGVDMQQFESNDPIPFTDKGLAVASVAIGISAMLFFAVVRDELAVQQRADQQTAMVDIAPAPPIEPPKGPLTTEEIIEQVEQSVARIEGLGGSGSGFLVRPQILATNYHVIERLFLEQVEVVFPSVTGKEKGPFSVKLLYADVDRDIAFLGVESKLPSITLAKDHQFRRGQEIIAIGSPGELENAVNLGVLSSAVKIDDQTYYQLGIAINPGNSGGPILDRSGNVIGIATLKSTKQEGIAYCIPISSVLEALMTAEKLTASQKEHNNSQHRARVALNLLTIVTVVCLRCMDDYDTYAELAIRKGRPINEGIQVIAEEIEEKMQIVEFIFLNRMEKEFDKIKQDSNLPYEFRKKLTEFYANCKEIKSYVDRPRGTLVSYREKMNELTEKGRRLDQELRSLLGLPAE